MPSEVREPNWVNIEDFVEEAAENHPEPLARALYWLMHYGSPLPTDLYIQLQSDGYDPESLMENF